MQYKVKYFTWILVCLSILVFIAACNPTRDRWLNRKWHTLTGHYNVYFNGELKFNDAVLGYEKTVQNDFSRILPVFLIPDEAASKGLTSSMDEVIKKTSKSIQMHTIGSYTDDSYFLMAKSQFYKGDYFAALESFQYVNSKYPDSDLKKECTAWIALCYDGLNKIGEAEAVMGLLVGEINPTVLVGKKKIPEKLQEKAEKITKAQKAFVYATAAHIYVKQEKYNLAADRLKVALAHTKDKPHRIRYNYILGQLYLLQDSIPQAKACFTVVTRLLAPYDFEFNANLNLIRTYNPNNKAEVKQVKRNLKRMLNDEKNAGLYDQVYFELAKIEHKDNDLVNAIKHYQLSIANSVKNLAQKTQSYLALGDIYLAKSSYKLGQAYYDSAAAVIPKEDKNYRKVQDKKNVLSELISNILNIETEDSLQQLSKLSKAELNKRVDAWILAKKLRAEQDAKNAVALKQQQEQAELNKPIGGAAPTLPSLGGAEQGQWYFYNPTVLTAGTQEFFSQRKWGRRENEDYWRIAAKEKVKPANGDRDAGKKDSTTSATKGDKTAPPEDGLVGKEKPQLSEDRADWVKDIPYTTEELKKSNQKIEESYHNLGDIYAVKIGDTKEGISSYNTLLKRFPNTAFEPEVLYQLYKLYNLQKETTKANAAKEELIKKYPESNYALIIQNKVVQSVESTEKKEVLKSYENLYQLYLDGNYTALKVAKKESDKKYSGNAMQAKFDLLYALAVGKTDSIEAFKAELEDLVKAYPKTDVAERASAILNLMKNPTANAKKDSVEAEPEFVLMPDAPHYYVFATKAEKFDMNDLLQKLIAHNEEYHQMESLRANTLITSDGYQILYVREFPKQDLAVKFLDGLNSLTFYKAYLPANTPYFHFAIPSEVFKRMMKEKKIEAYNTFFGQKLPSLLKQIKP